MEVDWQRARRPSIAVPVEERLPVEGLEVLVWITDEEVSIYDYPTVGRMRDGMWWAGVPGKWWMIASDRWTVTHWLDWREFDAKG